MIKNFTRTDCTYIHVAELAHGAPRTGLCLRTATAVYMALFTLRAHVRTLTNPHGKAPFVAVTKRKASCAAVVSWQLSLFDGCCCWCT